MKWKGAVDGCRSARGCGRCVDGWPRHIKDNCGRLQRQLSIKRHEGSRLAECARGTSFLCLLLEPSHLTKSRKRTCTNERLQCRHLRDLGQFSLRRSGKSHCRHLHSRQTRTTPKAMDTDTMIASKGSLIPIRARDKYIIFRWRTGN
jgi:hypothetical protein